MKNAVTESTLIPLGMAIVAIGGAASWMTVMNVRASAAEARQTAMELRISEVEKAQQQILQSLARIEGRLGTAPKSATERETHD